MLNNCIKIGIETHKSEWSGVQMQQRLLKQALDEHHLVVEQVIAREIRPDLVGADREPLAEGRQM